MWNPEVIPMNTRLVPRAVSYKLTPQSSTLKRVLEKLDIIPFTPESVAVYKREKLEQVTAELRPADGEEIGRSDFGLWEYFELERLQDEIAIRGLTGDEPVIRFWKTSRHQPVYTCLRWVKRTL